MALGSLSFNAHGSVSALLENYRVCLALELVGSCVELGFSLRMEVLGELLVSGVLSYCQVLELSLLPLPFLKPA